MKVIESTDFYLRVIKFDFINHSSDVKLKFRIVPVFHIGTEKFYENVFNQLNACDEVLFEALQFKKLIRLNRQYRAIAKKLDLVTQREHLKIKYLKPKLIHADFTFDQADEAWRKLNFKEKIKLQLGIPLKLRYNSRKITRRELGKANMTLAQEQRLAYGPLENEPGTMWNFLMNAREQIIFKILDKKMEQESQNEKLIGIVYGAGHMKTVARYLIDKFKYVPRNAEFLEVFPIR